ncbi:MAG: universal stress protein [Cocleimonas sp.]
MYNTIIVATDFSNEESTILALQKAAKLSVNDRIILLHVLEDIPTFALADISGDWKFDHAPRSQEILNKLVDQSGIKAEIDVRKGGTYRQIIEATKEHNADLVIINSHRPGLQDYLLGSTAAKVVRHSPSAVLVVR